MAFSCISQCSSKQSKEVHNKTTTSLKNFINDLKDESESAFSKFVDNTVLGSLHFRGQELWAKRPWKIGEMASNKQDEIQYR